MHANSPETSRSAQISFYAILAARRALSLEPRVSLWPLSQSSLTSLRMALACPRRDGMGRPGVILEIAAERIG